MKFIIGEDPTGNRHPVTFPEQWDHAAMWSALKAKSSPIPVALVNMVSAGKIFIDDGGKIFLELGSSTLKYAPMGKAYEEAFADAMFEFKMHFRDR